MRRALSHSRSLVAACLLAAGTLASITTTAHAQVGTAITYQGLLERNNVKVNTATDMRFTLFDAATAGNAVGTQVTLNAQSVSNGLFNVALDFGVNPYTADAPRWMQIEVRNPAGTGNFVPMGARQRLTAAPFSAATRGINVDGTGNVGIGTTTPESALHVAGIINGAPTLAGVHIGRGAAVGAGAIELVGTSGISLIDFHGTPGAGDFGARLIYTSGDDVFNFNSAANYNFNDGNVNIGTTGGSSKLNVVGPAGFTGNIGNMAQFNNPTGNRLSLAVNDRGGSAGVAEFNLDRPGIGWGDIAMATQGGSVGIGTNTPSHKLTVQGDTNTMRLIGPTGSFLWNARLNFGDADYVRISENDDDFLDFGARNGVRSANTFSAPAKNFRIDHPSDPQNKILNHGCIESDQYVNLYRGNATIGNDGGVWIQLPSWMNDLNTDFSYQLTSVGAAQPNLFVATEVNNQNQFRVAGGQPGAKVSWQVTGVRHDPYVRAHPLVVEQVKTGSEVGNYISPSSYGIFTQEELAKYGNK